jgi:Na+/glutamate symporter
VALYESADDYLDDVQRKVNVAKVAGTSVAMCGTLGTVAAVSILLAPATLGTSLAAGVAAGTATVAIGGSVAAIGADQLKKRKYDKEEEAKVTKVLEKDAACLNDFLEEVEKVRDLGREIVILNNEHKRELLKVSLSVCSSNVASH